MSHTNVILDVAKYVKKRKMIASKIIKPKNNSFKYHIWNYDFPIVVLEEKDRRFVHHDFEYDLAYTEVIKKLNRKVRNYIQTLAN